MKISEQDLPSGSQPQAKVDKLRLKEWSSIGKAVGHVGQLIGFVAATKAFNYGPKTRKVNEQHLCPVY